MPTSGSPKVWIGSTTDGVSNPTAVVAIEDVACDDELWANAAEVVMSTKPSATVCQRRTGIPPCPVLGRVAPCRQRAKARSLSPTDDGQPTEDLYVYRRFTSKTDIPFLKGRVGWHPARWSPGKIPRSAQRGLVFFSSTRLSWLALDSDCGRDYPALARASG